MNMTKIVGKIKWTNKYIFDWTPCSSKLKKTFGGVFSYTFDFLFCYEKNSWKERKSKSKSNTYIQHKVNSMYCCSLCEMGDIFQSALSKPEIRSWDQCYICQVHTRNSKHWFYILAVAIDYKCLTYFASKMYTLMPQLVIKSNNLKHITMARWLAWTNDSSTKRLMFQAFFFIISYRL